MKNSILEPMTIPMKRVFIIHPTERSTMKSALKKLILTDTDIDTHAR